MTDNVKEADEWKNKFWKHIKKERKMYDKNKDKIERKQKLKKHLIDDDEEEDEEYWEYNAEYKEDL